MEKPGYSDAQIIAILKQAETGSTVPELRWNYGDSALNSNLNLWPTLPRL
ncbi:MAG: hypothetical protein JKY17_04645 [Magnetovibrio sp.]|nr:hypothetical protein [Magnetovibrio sp.]MBL4748070.1 hypothetical protein [Magnetovibrio sp.]